MKSWVQKKDWLLEWGKTPAYKFLALGYKELKTMQVLKMHGAETVNPFSAVPEYQRMGDIKKERNELLRVLESGKPDVKTPASGEGGRERVPPELGPCLSVSVTVTQTRVTWEDGLLAEGFDCLAHKSIGHSS